MTTPAISRRLAFSGLSALGMAAALAGCGGSGESGSSKPSAAAGEELALTSEVPVGGGVVLFDKKIVLTQLTAGEFMAFTAVCTHRGLTVTSVERGKILCTYHGSSYSAESGEVEGGPATAPLAEVAVKIDGDQVVKA